MIRSQRAPSVAGRYVYREIDSDSQRFVQSPSKLPAHAGRLQGQLLPDCGWLASLPLSPGVLAPVLTALHLVPTFTTSLGWRRSTNKTGRAGRTLALEHAPAV